MSSGQPDTVGVLEDVIEVDVPVEKPVPVPADVVRLTEDGGNVPEKLGVPVVTLSEAPPLGLVICDIPPEKLPKLVLLLVVVSPV